MWRAYKRDHFAVKFLKLLFRNMLKRKEKKIQVCLVLKSLSKQQVVDLFYYHIGHDPIVSRWSTE